VLLLADSGYAPSNPEEWIKRANPQLIVLDVAAGDENGMPSQDTLKAVGGYTLLRTDMNGWISIATDGETMQVEVQKK
jgi:beta-lactamase superfamily II metal-dependent hydrolase